MALGMSTLKLKPISEYPPGGGYQRWTPIDDIAGALNDEGANYGPSSEYGNEQARAHYFNGSKAIPKPEYLEGASLWAATIHFQYQAGRTTGGHVFKLYGKLYSGHTDWKTPDIELYGEEEKSGTVNERRTDVVWDNIFWRYIYNGEDNSYIGPRCEQGTSAYGCWAKVWDYYIEIEFKVASVNTEAVTDITAHSGRGNGYITTLLDGFYEERGFEYYKDGDEENIQVVKETGEYTTGEFSLDITELDGETKYYVRAYAKKGDLTARGDWVDFTTLSPAVDVSGKASFSTNIEALLYKDPKIINIKATKLAGSLTLYGEITEKDAIIIERGFEYKIQDNEPEEEDTGTEVKETGEFGIEEYHLSSWDTFNDLYCAEEDKIWWFRAYCKDIYDHKFIADSWMKNVPILVTSACTETLLFSTKGHGELTDIGANIVTERGFHVIKEFSGSIFDISKYTHHGFIVLNMEWVPQYAPNGMLIGFLWVGKLLKVVSTKNIYGYDPEIYELDIGTGILDSLFPNDTYKVKAFGKNQLGRGFGEEVEVTTLQLIFEPEAEPEGDEPIESPTTAIKTVKVDNLPEGYKVVRIGIKYGRTPSCNEGMVYEDGEWYNGDSITFLIVDLIPREKYYESPFMTIEDDEGEQDEIEDPTEDFPDIVLPDFPDFPDIEFPLSDLVGIDYAIIIKEIKCSIIADQSIIDKYGRRRTLTIKNNLIQTLDFCISIRDDYLNRFQELKLKIDIDYDIPLPFEREDTILLAYGQINYKTDGNGVIGAKADGEGVIDGKMSILTKIRKININAKAEEAILTLELEV